jgi:hypothetical protein
MQEKIGGSHVSESRSFDRLRTGSGVPGTWLPKKLNEE